MSETSKRVLGGYHNAEPTGLRDPVDVSLTLAREVEVLAAERDELRAEVERLESLALEADRLLHIARRAASKLHTMYRRGECARRAEVDELIGDEQQITGWLTRHRAALKGGKR